MRFYTTRLWFCRGRYGKGLKSGFPCDGNGGEGRSRLVGFAFGSKMKSGIGCGGGGAFVLLIDGGIRIWGREIVGDETAKHLEEEQIEHAELFLLFVVADEVGVFKVESARAWLWCTGIVGRRRNRVSLCRHEERGMCKRMMSGVGAGTGAGGGGVLCFGIK